MANQPESPTYADGIYQWETTDPVQGGVGGLANLPLLQLASRTGFLNQGLTTLQQAIALLAAINSPTLTGTPRAPTPGPDASDTQIATAALLRQAVGGVSVVQITGPTALTAAQTGPGTIHLIGTTTSNTNILVPAAPGRWTIYNGTPFHVFIYTPTSTSGIGIAPLASKTVWTDGMGVYNAHQDYENVSFSGQVQTVTPPDGDASTLIPNTGWVARALTEALGDTVQVGGTGGNLHLNVGGFIVQGGAGVTTTGIGDQFPFPLAFPHAMIAGVAVEANANPGWFAGYPSPSPTIYGLMAAGAGAFTVSSVRLAPGSGNAYAVGGLSFNWMAIGY